MARAPEIATQGAAAVDAARHCSRLPPVPPYHARGSRLPMLLPPIPSPRTEEPAAGSVAPAPPLCAWELVGAVASAVCLCTPFLFADKMVESEHAMGSRRAEAEPQKRQSWYSVRPPTKTEVFTVRAVANPKDSVRHSQRDEIWPQFGDFATCSPNLRRAHSVPLSSERYWGMRSSEEPLPEEILCKLCCSEVADVVLLPCRHGGMCYRCFRRILFIKPLHRGGSTCPICRRPIREAVRINEEELHKPLAATQYGVGINVNVQPLW